MKVQPRLQSPLYHPHAHPTPEDQNKTHTNGVHSNSRPHYSASTNGHSNGDDMHPYQNPYGGGHGPPQQRQYAPNQLPPMYPNTSMPPPMPPPPGHGFAGPSNAPHSGIYSAASAPQLPLPASSLLPTQRQEIPKMLSTNDGVYNYELKVEQQPQRARMCGFGDKDRRPITPPPCIRLVITDVHTGLPVPHDQVDGMFYVLQVDLWDESGTREVNIVRSSSASPAVSISTATTTSYPPTPERPFSDYTPVVYTSADGTQMYGPAPGYGNPIGPRHPMPGQGYSGYYAPPPFPGPMAPVSYMPPAPTFGPPPPNHSMFTRNLIGSLTVNASSLKDPEGKQGFWFVLQDLSVRTEGFFKLKMNFINVKAPALDGLNKRVAPVLAYVFSEKFQVYSAKKFPGVIESTPLSKCFAGQGIKIPIRKDVKPERDGDDDD